MVVNKKIELLLTELGLTDYQARSYLALLTCQPATAYEIAKESGIPSSKIYETVSRLLEKKLIQAVENKKDRGQKYVALNAKDFVNTKQEETIRKTERLNGLLDSIEINDTNNLIWSLNDEQSVYDKAKQFIRQAQSSILISLWAEELTVLEENLQDAEDRGIKIALVHFGIPKKKIGTTFHHPVEQTLYQEKGGRSLTLVVDSELMVVATFLDKGGIEGAWSRNHAFVKVAEDYVRHDVYITKVVATMGKELQQVFGENYADLRNIFKPVE